MSKIQHFADQWNRWQAKILIFPPAVNNNYSSYRHFSAYIRSHVTFESPDSSLLFLPSTKQLVREAATNVYNVVSPF